jgi:organic radical activating enzyme
MPEKFIDWDFENHYLQPLDKAYIVSSNDDDNYVQQTIDYCMQHPRWRLSLQTHKITGIR